MTRFESPDELLVVAAILGNLEAFEEIVDGEVEDSSRQETVESKS